MELVNEKRVLDFYIDEIDKEAIVFLKDRPKYGEEIKKLILELREETEMHNKITICKNLWKVLFEASMSFIDPDRRGYDDLFNYFDEYVDFEELIFASDSFYRDHTMHCLWVYFLGEYIIKNDEFKEFVGKYGVSNDGILKGIESIKKHNLSDVFHYMMDFKDMVEQAYSYNDSIRCICALTHDLGYPIKKISSINKNIKRILPHFGINNFTEFGFNYSDIHDNFIKDFLNFMSYNFTFDITNDDIDKKTDDIGKQADDIFSKLFMLDKKKDTFEIDEEILPQITEDIKKRFKRGVVKKSIHFDYSRHIRYSKDLENYQHGIMSAFLIFRKLAVFYNRSFAYTDFSSINATNFDYIKISSLADILTQISDHTSEDYRIKQLDDHSFLTFVDELEEFSRMSRANRNRQYINEFCKSNIYAQDGYLNIDFIFDNTEIDNLDPEKAFKGRCKRFLTLFNLRELDDKLKIKLRCIGKLPYDNNVYMLKIRKKYANIMINDEEKDIQKYLKTRQFLTKEEYEAL